VGGNRAVEEDRVGIIDDLLEDEVLQLNTRGEGRIEGLVARSELRALGDGVVVGAPDELDGITNGSVDGEGEVSEDTLGRGNPDNVSLASLSGSFRGRGQSRELGLALLNTVVEGVASPGVTPRTIGRGRLGLMRRGRGRLGCISRGRRTILIRRGSVGGGIGREAQVLAVLGGEGSGGSPGVLRWGVITRWRRVDVRGREHEVAV
jgi:hypothetical protein